jgi:hypothetical protein
MYIISLRPVLVFLLFSSNPVFKMFTGSVTVTSMLVNLLSRLISVYSLHIVQVALVEYYNPLGHEAVIICNFYRRSGGESGCLHD